ncbi:MAG: His/Gly/Thr/Pro-type tRNA ligase C-terminal domain-containing protein [Candidatus Pacebacteria bacterium]|nr:His/Gly/Thr/Pro-type tRNA ligase C-terminal domain-containing protein [Candidatus Paceibacterota bacterium]NUQ57630.1 prolyl-tRNA synthetase [Candidatus Paceibacter sp.]
MLQSKLFAKTRKESPKDEISKNAELLVRGGFADKLMSGVYTYLPLGLRVIKKIENIIREEMAAAGGQELLMPSLHPKENWEKTGRWDTVDDLFRFTSYYSKTELALGPTHEEIISPLVKKFNLSYKDLPVYLFQFQNKFRDEKRAKSGLLRTREFLMKDLYSFHSDENDMDDYYEKMKVHYKNIFDKCGIGGKTYLTYASGGTFSKYSHEYQTLTGAGEDIICICGDCGAAANKEIMDGGMKCPECGGGKLKEEKSVEVGNIFKLKNKFSEPFNLVYADASGQEKPVLMGCYGIGLGRLMGTIVETSNDKNGIIWPKSVAPFAVHLLELNSPKDGKEVKNLAVKVYSELAGKGVEVLYDDREEASAGQKFADADLLGIPLRVVISGKTASEGKVELKGRTEEKGRLAKPEEILAEL